MDRSSIATTASAPLSLPDQEFYDSPRPHHCPCCAPPTATSSTGCSSCCTPHNHAHYSHPQTSRRVVAPPDPMENYDVPPPSHHNHPHQHLHPQMQHSITSTSISINGEGKMPLVTGSIPAINPNAIYAQVDKSKKTQRLPVTCDNNLPIYENRAAVHQPTYINLSTTNEALINKTSKPPAPDSTHPHPHSNYVNLQFAESLQLYENAKEISSTKETTTQVLVHPEPKSQPSENTYENMGVAAEVGGGTETDAEATPTAETPTVSDSGIDSTTNPSGSTSAEDSRRGSQDSSTEDAANPPLRRSSSVPCKGGHANRGSASSSDSGVSGDCALFFEESSSSPSNNDMGRYVPNPLTSLC